MNQPIVIDEDHLIGTNGSRSDSQFVCFLEPAPFEVTDRDARSSCNHQWGRNSADASTEAFQIRRLVSANHLRDDANRHFPERRDLVACFERPPPDDG